ncbi:uncharacterized protein BO97DRAFT_216424 [Aspergillus homomorphus CBS 101889]|uniref:Uncharacterized protein n=1 Tax=Aspergillus homomorphus (strain CBS 101889) TaxID=1450537 RepID=A0A395I5T3_ASPHC|nr:hypothetical protein BO97DRAFT_216424 [Aspergillus homomorphus CBS 101889]RAL15571.1 hypothetical protein BO97DRAFT_216424 [Aspergillus homomorphus CBS 101889]
MTTRSGLEGFCDVCRHANDIHKTARCPAKRCRNMWKLCTSGTCFENGLKEYRLCFGCVAHPGMKGMVEFKEENPDVTKKQSKDYKKTGQPGGDTPSGETKAEEVRRQLEKDNQETPSRLGKNRR